MGKIDCLPPALKAAVIDGIIKGRPLREIAKLVPCSPTVIMRYRDAVVIPSLTGKPLGDPRSPSPVQPAGQTVQLAEQMDTPTSSTRGHTNIRDMVRASPVRERVQKLWDRTDKLLDKVDEKESLIAVAPGLLNQAHKNVELLAKMTGEIQDGRGGGGPAVAVQIVYHGSEPPAVTIDQHGNIDAPGVSIGVSKP